MHYFTQQDDHWRISERLRNQVTFRKQNLIEQTASLGMFDIVLCRNVLTYFDGPTKTEILSRIGKQLNPSGILVLGVNESVVGLSTEFDTLNDRRGVFQLSSKAVKAA